MSRLLLIMCIVSIFLTGNAQSIEEERNAFEKFRVNINDDFDNFRNKITQEFIEFVRNPWNKCVAKVPVSEPSIELVPPTTISDYINKNQHTQINIGGIIQPLQISQRPHPIEPITEAPEMESDCISFLYFGTNCHVRYKRNNRYHIDRMTENDIANALTTIATRETDNLMYDCLKAREELQLCDWAYLLFLKKMSDAIYGEGSNEATLLMAYIYMQSGYKMRLAYNGSKLYMLYGSKHIIFGQSSYEIDETFYYSLSELPNNLMISNACFPKESSLSLIIDQQPSLSISLSKKRNIISDTYPAFNFDTDVNYNLIDFYSTYPASYYNGNIMTKWAQYANTPISKHVRSTLYTKIRKSISGLSEIDAVNRILNWIQTGFNYEYDKTIWGHDRSFFAEETLYYPHCDCEDRCILFTRIIRDLLKLDCILIYKPSHLTTAVAFNSDISGNYILLNNKKYIVCDPTIIGAEAGYNIENKDSVTVNVIMLYK